MFIISYIFLLGLSHIAANQTCTPAFISIKNQSIEIYEENYKNYTKRSDLGSPEPLLHQNLSVQAFLETTPCGVSARDPDQMIIAGGPAPEKLFPWQVGLVSPRGLCGGVLISSSWALTAAHCPVGENTTGILGSVLLHTRHPRKQIRRVKIAVRHENFSLKSLLNDVALVKFDSPVVLNDYVRPICLPKKGDVFDGVNACFISGWGRLSKSPGPKPPLQFGRTSVMPESICFYTLRLYGRHLKKGELCSDLAGSFVGRGDSGGPLSCKVGGRYYAAGLASYTIKPPRRDITFLPEMFSKVSEFIDWILKTIEEHGL
ncbi:unnamed protein product [Lymnaea stagnalis]|uniref:Peptidase S1 domain-containing protein n=1 Tax=Lymnaea stagnalis TaxID=6523 RepID=A0AAV2HTJ3_LYMST